MEKYNFIFVILVYRNTDVLKDFFDSLQIYDYRVIVVESFYNEKTSQQCKKISEINGATYLSIPNKGYGYGNNIGVQYAIDNYEFNYLIISNSDIIINKIDFLCDKKISNSPIVLAPKLKIKSTGKAQNPNIVFYNRWIYNLFFKGYKNNNKKLITFVRFYIRLIRELFLLYTKVIKKDKYKIFCPHGAFIILNYTAVKFLNPLFNNNMFLYNEESYFATKCKINNIPIFYVPSINISHLEGASTSNEGKGYIINKESFTILYNWIKEIDTKNTK